VVRCDYYDAALCRSCVLLPQPYADQLADKATRARVAVGEHAGLEWDPPVASAEQGFRNKAKMAVAGTVDAPTLGILDAAGHGTDLRGCQLHTSGILAALPVLAAVVTAARLTPYDVPTRRGELKYLLVTEGDGLMVRFVLRSTEAVARIRKQVPALLEVLGQDTVISVNLQPEHKAVLEGEREIPLAGRSLRMPVGDVVLHLRPQSFFQTNTAVAAALYADARAWTAGLDATSAWDLFCGAGGFALHIVRPGRDVLGVEISGDAVASALQSRDEAGLTGVRFQAGDAGAFAREAAVVPDLVVVNPPRRGIGRLAGWLEGSGVRHVLYSSCNVDTLARDLAAMPSLAPRRARAFDMFPHAAHHETLVLLERR
jgi:23S rRNA (uracil747-C5)-methyltransferase